MQLPMLLINIQSIKMNDTSMLETVHKRDRQGTELDNYMMPLFWAGPIFSSLMKVTFYMVDVSDASIGCTFIGFQGIMVLNISSHFDCRTAEAVKTSNAITNVIDQYLVQWKCMRLQCLSQSIKEIDKELNQITYDATTLGRPNFLPF